MLQRWDGRVTWVCVDRRVWMQIQKQVKVNEYGGVVAVAGMAMAILNRMQLVVMLPSLLMLWAAAFVVLGRMAVVRFRELEVQKIWRADGRHKSLRCLYTLQCIV